MSNFIPSNCPPPGQEVTVVCGGNDFCREEMREALLALCAIDPADFQTFNISTTSSGGAQDINVDHIVGVGQGIVQVEDTNNTFWIISICQIVGVQYSFRNTSPVQDPIPPNTCTPDTTP